MAHSPKAIQLEKTTVIDPGSDLPDIEPVDLDLPQGRARCHDAESCTIITAQRRRGDHFVVIISAGMFAGRRLGTLAQMTPTEARQFAASLIAGADECDGGMKGAN